MNQNLTEKQIRELENQLSCPNGENGIKVGQIMNESNIGMTLNTIEFLELENQNSVLEIGYGNCGHLDKLLNSAKKINYCGIEISETMFNEAKKNNADKPAEFKLYNGNEIPYPKQFFDKILSVNTIYFWSNTEKMIKEIERVLKPNGLCVLTYGNKEFMKSLPFVGQKFKLFGQNEIKKLVEKSNLKIVGTKELTDQVKSKTGKQVKRKYTMIKLKRPSK